MGGTVQLAWRNGQVVDGAVVQPFAVREVGFGLDATEVAGSSVVGTRSLLGDAKGAQLDVGLLAWVASPLTTSREVTIIYSMLIIWTNYSYLPRSFAR